MGVSGGNVTDEDFYKDIFVADTHSTLFFFTTKGNLFTKKVYAIPEGSRTSKGRNIVNFLQIPSGEHIAGTLCMGDLDSFEGKCLFFATEKGLVKKTFLSEYSSALKRVSGLRAVKILDDDSLMGVRLLDGAKDILLCSSAGKIIRFSESNCRPLGRVSQGVIGMRLEKGEKIVGLDVINQEMEILTVTNKGYGKRTSTKLYRGQSRGGRGLVGMKLTEAKGKVKVMRLVTKEEKLLIISDKGQVIKLKVSEIALSGRATQGVRIIKLKSGEKVVSVENFLAPEE